MGRYIRTKKVIMLNKDQQEQFKRDAVHHTNGELGDKYSLSDQEVRYYITKHGIKRTPSFKIVTSKVLEYLKENMETDNILCGLVLDMPPYRVELIKEEIRTNKKRRKHR